MSVEPIPAGRRPKPITLARPGHADLAGAIKYDTADIRDVLERASARSTAPRVAAGSVCRQLLASVGVRTVWSFVDQLGPIRAFPMSMTRSTASAMAGGSVTGSIRPRSAARIRSPRRP